LPAKWTAEIVGGMHLNGITAKELAKALGYHPKYVSAVLNGHREPKNAEKVFKEALEKIISQKRVR